MTRLYPALTKTPDELVTLICQSGERLEVLTQQISEEIKITDALLKEYKAWKTVRMGACPECGQLITIYMHESVLPRYVHHAKPVCSEFQSSGDGGVELLARVHWVYPQSSDSEAEAKLSEGG